MTIQEAKNKLISYAQGEIGYHEGANNYNKYAPLWTQAGGWNAQSQPWCDLWYDVAMIQCFGLDLASKLTYQPIGSFSALCSASARFYKNNGAWYTTPEVGDQVFFYSGGDINHTGLVETVSGGYFTTIEGNSSDMVARRSYYIGNSYVAGFGRPNWSVVQFYNSNNNSSSNNNQSSNTNNNSSSNSNSSSNNTTTPASGTNFYPLITRGSSKKIAVRAIQQLLIKRGFNCGGWGTDGDFGWGTYQSLRDFQRQNNLTVDGECGAFTWCCLISNRLDGSKPTELKKGMSSREVKSAQQLLILNDCSCGSWGDDGDFGSDTEKAVKEFKKKVMNISNPTGEIDINTWKNLIGG